MNQGTGAPVRYKRKWSNLLLNRRFQLKYTGMIVGVSTIISVLLGSFLVEKMRENSRMLQLEADFDEIIQAQLAQEDAQMVLVMVGAFLIFNIILALLAVFVTHRMAGPIFVVKRYVRAIGDGEIPELRRLRKGDEFRDLLEVIQESVHAIEARTRDEADALSRAMTALEGNDADGAKKALEPLLESRKKMLEGR